MVLPAAIDRKTVVAAGEASVMPVPFRPGSGALRRRPTMSGPRSASRAAGEARTATPWLSFRAAAVSPVGLDHRDALSCHAAVKPASQHGTAHLAAADQDQGRRHGGSSLAHGVDQSHGYGLGRRSPAPDDVLEGGVVAIAIGHRRFHDVVHLLDRRPTGSAQGQARGETWATPRRSTARSDRATCVSLTRANSSCTRACLAGGTRMSKAQVNWTATASVFQAKYRL